MSTAPNGKVAHAASPAAAGRTGKPGATPTSGSPGPAHLPKSAAVDKIVAEAMAGKPGKGGKPKKEKVPVTRKQMITTVAAAVVVLGVGVGVYAYFGRTEVPVGPFPVKDKTETIAKNIASSKFDDLPFRRKRIVLEDFADRKKEFKALHANHQMTDEQVKDALSYAWIGKKFKEISNYNNMSAAEKRDYIQRLLDKKIKDKVDDEDDDDIKGADGKLIKKDPKKIESIMDRFPTEERASILAFERTLKDAENVRKQEIKRIERAAKAAAASRPTTRPGETPKVKPDAAAPAKSK